MTKTALKKLETEMENDFRAHREAGREQRRQEGSRRGVRFVGTITRFGMVKALGQLLNSRTNKAKEFARSRERGWGFFLEKRYILHPKYRPLFTPEQIAQARQRVEIPLE